MPGECSSGAVRTLAIESFCGSGDAGWYFSATDPAPKPGEYRDLTQGSVVHGEFALTFTVLSNGDAGRAKAATLAALRELACHSAEQPPASISPSQSGADLRLPGAAWSVHLDLPGFAIEEQGRNAGTGGVMLKAYSRGSGVILTAFIERASGTPTAAECLARTWPHARARPQKDAALARRRLGAMEVGEFTLRLDEGMWNKHVNG